MLKFLPAMFCSKLVMRLVFISGHTGYRIVGLRQQNYMLQAVNFICKEEFVTCRGHNLTDVHALTHDARRLIQIIISQIIIMLLFL